MGINKAAQRRASQHLNNLDKASWEQLQHCGKVLNIAIHHYPVNKPRIPLSTQELIVAIRNRVNRGTFATNLARFSNAMEDFEQLRASFATQQEIAREEEEIEQWAKEYNEPPKPLETPDLRELENLCKKYLACIANPDMDYEQCNEMDDQIVEAALASLFGPDIFDWITAQVTDD
jgi:hypothetical protein